MLCRLTGRGIPYCAITNGNLDRFNCSLESIESNGTSHPWGSWIAAHWYTNPRSRWELISSGGALCWPEKGFGSWVSLERQSISLLDSDQSHSHVPEYTWSSGLRIEVWNGWLYVNLHFTNPYMQSSLKAKLARILGELNKTPSRLQFLNIYIPPLNRCNDIRDFGISRNGLVQGMKIWLDLLGWREVEGKREEGREVGVWRVESNEWYYDSSVSVISKYDIEMPVRSPGCSRGFQQYRA